MQLVDRTAFLAARREAIQIASDRVFRGSTVPIPELGEWPGIYRPTIKPTFTQYISMPLPKPKPVRVRKPKVYVPKSKRSKWVGDVEPGTIVPSGNHHGKVVCFVPAGVDPMPLCPPGTNTTTLGGHRWHGPSAIARYYIQVEHNGVTYHHFPSATSIERSLANEI